jgi:hypothetical protein
MKNIRLLLPLFVIDFPISSTMQSCCMITYVYSEYFVRYLAWVNFTAESSFLSSVGFLCDFWIESRPIFRSVTYNTRVYTEFSTSGPLQSNLFITLLYVDFGSAILSFLKWHLVFSVLTRGSASILIVSRSDCTLNDASSGSLLFDFVPGKTRECSR